ncbi:MAG: YjbQ family protein [Armatimonadetes bacterium]|nr:YjbQ family protein [Armatimonadota bacterium]
MTAVKIPVRTSKPTEMVDITARVSEAVRRSGVSEGLCTVFVAHTTAGVTINENFDPDVRHDFLGALERMVPLASPDYRHDEGNSAAHVKASLVGSSATVIVAAGRLQLGTWQALFFCEFDGPRSREAWVKVMAG